MQISHNDFNRFRNILEERSGILLADNKKYLVVSRLTRFIQKNEFDSFTELFNYIELNPYSFLSYEAIELMTTNETLWFRDSYPFEYLKHSIFPGWKKNPTNFKILCAACSSGQEPYSVAMLLDKANLLDATQIIATDLSEKALLKAKKGFYQKIETERGLSEEYLLRYFSNEAELGWKIKPAIINSVNFQKLNLLNTPYHFRQFDIIFCRNVLIYFSDSNKAKVLNALVDCLKPGGYLFLGASESPLPYVSSLKMQVNHSGIVYQK